MITKNDIINYFDQEAEFSKVAYDKQMKLSLEERIRKRKAIGGITLDIEYHKTSKEGNVLLKLRPIRNISDFKEGEYLLLHKEYSTSGLQCQLYEFDENDNIIISVYKDDFNIDIVTWGNESLVLDKALIDLRDKIYSNFYYGLSSDKNYWEKQLINSIQKPSFKDKEKYSEELEDTAKNFELAFTDMQREAILNSMSSDNYYLIQGPPGTGKSFILSVIILEELFFFRRKVAIVGPNHMAINNAMLQVLKLVVPLQQYKKMIKIGPLFHAHDLSIIRNEQKFELLKYERINASVANSLEDPLLYGLTPHALYTSRARNLNFDTLIIDEAGQMTIPLALMAMTKSKKVILAGDHKQLPPIITSDKVNEELKSSIFQRLTNKDNSTMLDLSFRMREPICEFVSELFYDNKLKAKTQGCGDKIICNDPLYSFNKPIILCHVNDEGLQFSERESDTIAVIVKNYLLLGLSADNIGILSPFRAQMANIRQAIKAECKIKKESRNKIVVDTIDKMQGQEREVIILSLASGNLSYMTEMGDFLYNSNKLNVAFSRAKSKLIIVGNIIKLKQLDKSLFPLVHKILESPKVQIINLK